MLKRQLKTFTFHYVSILIVNVPFAPVVVASIFTFHYVSILISQAIANKLYVANLHSIMSLF